MRWPLLLSILLVTACSATTDGRDLDSSGLGSSGGSSSGGFSGFTGGVAPRSGGIIASGGSTGTVGAMCKPGRYVGDFEGTYRSQLWGNGDPNAALMIQGLADPITGREPLEFRLEKKEGAAECGPTEEFCAGFKVTGGKMMGGADPFMSGLLSVHFEIDLTGELDCRTGEFRGQLSNGFYDFATVLYHFEGELSGHYDGEKFTFGPGDWSVVEEPQAGAIIPPSTSIGGEGTWQAAWVEP